MGPTPWRMYEWMIFVLLFVILDGWIKSFSKFCQNPYSHHSSNSRWMSGGSGDGPSFEHVCFTLIQFDIFQCRRQDSSTGGGDIKIWGPLGFSKTYKKFWAKHRGNQPLGEIFPARGHVFLSSPGTDIFLCPGVKCLFRCVICPFLVAAFIYLFLSNIIDLSTQS